MTDVNVNAAEPRPLRVVPCDLLRHGNANDLHGWRETTMRRKVGCARCVHREIKENQAKTDLGGRAMSASLRAAGSMADDRTSPRTQH